MISHGRGAEIRQGFGGEHPRDTKMSEEPEHRQPELVIANHRQGGEGGRLRRMIVRRDPDIVIGEEIPSLTREEAVAHEG